MESKNEEKRLVLIIRGLIVFYMLSLLFFGITVFPLEAELRIVCQILGISPDASPNNYTGFLNWIATVNEGLVNTNRDYPFLHYGFDWLAFSHIAIAASFIGLYVKPVRNIWIVYFALIACLGVVPLSFICGAVREIPFYWRLIDASFALTGSIPLFFLLKYIKRLEKLTGKIVSKY